MTLALAALLAFVGVGVGSVLNVVIDRLPAKLPIVFPGRCTGCGTPLAGRDAVALASWPLGGRRCRTCGVTPTVRYPMVEVLTGALFSGASVRLGAVWALPAFCVFFAALVAISVIDLERYIIPNRIVYPTLFVTAPILGLAAAVDGGWAPLEHAAIGGIVCFAALLVVHLVAPSGMGFGDVRLVAVIGMMLGWLGLGYAALAFILAFLLASVVGLGLIATGVRSRRDAVPFGPFLAGGAVIAVLWGRPILDAYARSRG